MDPDRAYDRAELIKAFAHPTRLRILGELSKGTRCVTDIEDVPPVCRLDAGLPETDRAIRHPLRGLGEVATEFVPGNFLLMPHFREYLSLLLAIRSGNDDRIVQV